MLAVHGLRCGTESRGDAPDCSDCCRACRFAGNGRCEHHNDRSCRVADDLDRWHIDKRNDRERGDVHLLVDVRLVDGVYVNGDEADLDFTDNDYYHDKTDLNHYKADNKAVGTALNGGGGDAWCVGLVY